MGHINARGVFLIRSVNSSINLCLDLFLVFCVFVVVSKNIFVHSNPFPRESEQNPGGFALSIKDWEQVRVTCHLSPVTCHSCRITPLCPRMHGILCRSGVTT